MNNPALFFDDNDLSIKLPFRNTDGYSAVFSSYDVSSVDYVYNPFAFGTIIGLDGVKTNLPYNNNDFYDSQGGTSVNNPLPYLMTGECRIYPRLGRKDIKSILLTRSSIQASGLGDRNKWNLQDFPNWLSQFPRLNSFSLTTNSYGYTQGRAVIGGDLALIPKHIKRVKIGVIEVGFTLVYNFDNTPNDSQLEEFHHQSDYTVYNGFLPTMGDIAKLPPNIKYFHLHNFRASDLHTYTAGRIWRSDFDKFYFNKVLSSTIIDNILNDMANSITTAIGEKIIYLRGTRTNASDDAVTYLQSLGFTVTITA